MSDGRRRLPTFVLGVVAGAAVAIALLAFVGPLQDLLPDNRTPNRTAEAQQVIEDSYFRPADSEELQNASINGMVKRISKENDDKFSHYFDPATYKPYVAKSAADLLKTFDDNVAKGKQALAAATEESLEQPWSLKIKGRVQFERPRADVFRDFALSHVIHHRGQFSVYLRLLDIPVPGSYGPSADELAGDK